MNFLRTGILALVTGMIAFCSEPEQARNPAAKQAQKLAPETEPSTAESPDMNKDKWNLLKSGEGQIDVPIAEGQGETHSRHAFALPQNARGVSVVLKWSDLSWKDVELAIGTGICPHRGTQLASAASRDGKAVVKFEDPELATKYNLPWFFHVNIDNALPEKYGQLFEYGFEIYTF